MFFILKIFLILNILHFENGDAATSNGNRSYRTIPRLIFFIFAMLLLVLHSFPFFFRYNLLRVSDPSTQLENTQ